MIVGEHLHIQHQIPFENIGVITGPCHAEEVAMERLSYLTIACQDDEKASVLSEVISGDYIKCKISDDIIGTEYAAMLKNIYAIAAGIAHGLGYGDNFQAVLMSNAIREMKAYIKRLNELRDEYDTADKPFDIWGAGAAAFTQEGLQELADIGVTGVGIGFRDVYKGQPDAPLEEKIQQLQWYASEFINKED